MKVDDKMQWDFISQKNQHQILECLVDIIFTVGKSQNITISSNLLLSDEDNKAMGTFEEVQQATNLDKLLVKVGIWEVQDIVRKTSIFYVNKGLDIIEENEVDFKNPIGIISIGSIKQKKSFFSLKPSENKIEFTTYAGIEFPHCMENPTHLKGSYGGGLKNQWKYENSTWERISPYSFAKSEVRNT